MTQLFKQYRNRNNPEEIIEARGFGSRINLKTGKILPTILFKVEGKRFVQDMILSEFDQQFEEIPND